MNGCLPFIKMLLHLRQNSDGAFVSACFWVSISFISSCVCPSTCVTQCGLQELSSLRIVFVLTVPFLFYINFRNNICIYKNSCWDFESNCIKSVYQFGENWYLLLYWVFQPVNMVHLSLFRDSFTSLISIL